MFAPGSILYGLFKLNTTTKYKYAIVLYNDGHNAIVTTFTTSQLRSILNPEHGANPKDIPMCYVFKKNIPIGIKPDGDVFSFPLDSTVVADYGYAYSTIESFLAKVSELRKVCELYDREYENLIYTLYKCPAMGKIYKTIFEKILQQRSE